MKRRQFITLVAGAAAAWPLAARAQQSSNKIPLVGVLWHADSAEEEDVYLRPLRKAFNDLGYIEEKNIHLEHRFPAENPDRFQTMARELALLKEAVPNLSRVALVVWPAYPFIERVITSYEKAAQNLGISLWPVEISGPDDVEPAFAKMVTDRADGFALTLGPLLFNLRARIGASALAHHLPGICFIGEEVPYGFMMSYGQDFPDFFRRAAAYTDKILKGAKPADLPVEQPTKFKLVLNLKTAKALGITFPQSLIVSADEVIGV
jgi:ABC transporter substrate binding protein